MNKKIIYFLMLSCQKATFLIEKESLTGLSFKENIRLRMHKSLCDACTNYEKQSKLIDQILQGEIFNDNQTLVSNESLREKILSKL